jgi:hypothetical protein
MMGWFKPDKTFTTTSGNYLTPLHCGGFGNNATDIDFYLKGNGSAVDIEIWALDASVARIIVSSAVSLDSDHWYHFAVMCDVRAAGNPLVCYVNGKPVGYGTLGSGGSLGTTRTVVGDDTFGTFYNGYAADCRFYVDWRMSAEDIKHCMMGYVPRPERLWAHWLMTCPLQEKDLGPRGNFTSNPANPIVLTRVVPKTGRPRSRTQFLLNSIAAITAAAPTFFGTRPEGLPFTRKALDARNISEPSFAWTTNFLDQNIVNRWAAVWAAQPEFRSPDPARIDVKNIDQPDFKLQVITDPIIASYAPVWDQETGYRVFDAKKVAVNNVPEPIFSWVDLVNDAVLARLIPPLYMPDSYVAPPAKTLDLRQWQPSFAWVEKVVEAIIASIYPPSLEPPQPYPPAKLNVGEINEPDLEGWLGALFAVTPFDPTQVWAGIEQLLRSYRLSDPRKPITTAPQFNWLMDFLFDPSQGQWAAIEQLLRSYRATDSRKVDVTSVNEPQFGWVEQLVESIIASYAGVWREELSSVRTNDARKIESNIAQPEFDWFFNALVAYDPSTSWAAIEQLFRSYRLNDPRRLVVNDPQFSWLMSFLYDPSQGQWAAIEELLRSYRVNDPRKVDPTNVSEPEFGWVEQVVEAIIASEMVPVFAQPSYVAPRAPSIDIRQWEPIFSWVNSVTDALIAQSIPGIYHSSLRYRAAMQALIDARNVPQPSSAWLGKAVDAIIAAYLAIWQQQYSSFTMRGAKIDHRNVPPPEFSGVFPADLSPPYDPTPFPSILMELLSSFRSNEGQRLNLQRLYYPDNMGVFYQPPPPPILKNNEYIVTYRRRRR